MTSYLDENKKTLPDGALYRLVWRWHFYAGLFVAPFAVILALTGALYLFQPQIENMLYARLYHVSPATHSISADAQLSAAQTAFPGKPLSYMPPRTATNSAMFRIRDNNGDQKLVAIDPHNGAVLGAIDDDKRPMQFIRDLHGKLLLGTTGQAIVELAASWVVVLLVTGLYLWWPRGRGLFGVLVPRLHKNGRVFWRDLHAVTGFWLSFFVVFLILSGLPWSLVAGRVIQTIENRIGATPQTGMGWDGGGSKTVQSETTHQGWSTDHAKHMTGAAYSTQGAAANATPLTLTQMTALVEKIPDLTRPYSLYFPVDAHGVYSVSSVQVSMPESTAYIHFDQYSGKIISQTRWKDFKPMAKAISIGVSLHEGKYFGLANQLVNLTVCLGLVGLIVAGLTLWWKRRPPGQLGAPKLQSKPSVGKGVIAIIMILGLLMPLMGASIILILVGEWMVGKWKRR